MYLFIFYGFGTFNMFRIVKGSNYSFVNVNLTYNASNVCEIEVCH